MLPVRRAAALILKISIVALASLGTLSLLAQLLGLARRPDTGEAAHTQEATEDRRGRVYEARRNLTAAACQRFEAEVNQNIANKC